MVAALFEHHLNFIMKYQYYNHEEETEQVESHSMNNNDKKVQK